MDIVNAVDSELSAALDQLNTIDDSIRGLQEKSTRISSGLANRVEVREELLRILGNLQIPEDVEKRVNEGELDEDYQCAVLQLDELMNRASEIQLQGVKAASEVLIKGGRILKQANSKTFAHFTLRLNTIGKDIGNLGVLQQSAFLKFGGLYRILGKYDDAMATAFRKDYISIARNFYYQLYSDAVKQFCLKKSVPLPPTPLIGDTKQSNSFTRLADRFKNAFSSGASRGFNFENNQTSVSIVTKTNQSEIVTAFFAVARLLFDSIQCESEFMVEFFKFPSAQDSIGLLKELFSRPTSSFKCRLQEKFALANLGEVMLMMTKLKELQQACQEGSFGRKVFDRYVDYIMSRAEYLILDQIKSLDVALGKVEPTTSISIVTRRFANFILDSASAMEGNTNSWDILKPILQGMDKYLSHSAAMVVNSRSQSIYMINNYDYLVTFMENSFRKGNHSVYCSDLIETYETRLNSVVNSFVVDELRPYFAQLFEFLEQHELGHPLDVPAVIIKDFNENVSTRLKAIHRSIIEIFSSYRTAVFVINVMYSQLLTAYSRFTDVHDEIVGKECRQENIPSPISVSGVEQIIRHCQSIFSATNR